jgi:hypothetical protein
MRTDCRIWPTRGTPRRRRSARPTRRPAHCEAKCAGAEILAKIETMTPPSLQITGKQSTQIYCLRRNIFSFVNSACCAAHKIFFMPISLARRENARIFRLA